ncbi:vacuolar protein sorting-associated protein 51 homolog [Oscarella lobularis]|uniref:vacuolar protein sorting-associated protein 51 homolog n=1 Tax=Oscarella lobularis TaxID=121494 RepID=UPI0033143DB1
MSDEANGSEAPDGESQPRRRQRRGLLRLYYGVTSEEDSSRLDPTDIDGPHFKTDVFLERLYKEASLRTLMDKEASMIREIKSLDSDMQTLVYENYNKFISATDTIRTMKHDFKRMEDEMESLAANMETIRDFSDRINDTLADKRQKIKKLSGVHGMLKKLQFLFELPSRLKKCMEMGAHSQAVRYYCRACGVLDHFQHMPSFHGIQQDCQKIVQEIRVKLSRQLSDESATSAQLSECVDLLLQLKEPAEDLCNQFLARSKLKLDAELAKLSRSSEQEDSDYLSDILQYVDCGCNGFLSNLSLVIVAFQDLFLKPNDANREIVRVARPKLAEFVDALLHPYLNCVRDRLITEAKSKETSMLVRAVDRLHRRLQALGKLVPSLDMPKICMEIVLPAAEERVNFCSNDLRSYFSSCLMDVRQALATRSQKMSVSSDGSSTTGLFSELLSSLSSSTIDKLKATFASLKEFVASDVTFATKQYFRSKFCREWVSNGLVVGFIEHIFETATGFCEESVSREATGPPLILILSRLCLDFEQSTVSYLVSLTDELFPLLERGAVSATPISSLCSRARRAAQTLITFYVEAEGNGISQMIRKSVETRDWLSSIEPRNVRAVMKRVVEDLSTLDLQAGTLYEEGQRRDRSSDDSRRTWTYSQSRQMGKPWGGYTPSTGVDTSLLSNIQKLFSERIEIFSPVEFTRVSILTGIIKIVLKTLMECVRIKTFGKFGLQQIQVDSHYLQLYLWRFVSDENIVLFLLDEVMNSAVNRCIEPLLMEPSIVEVICNQG